MRLLPLSELALRSTVRKPLRLCLLGILALTASNAIAGPVEAEHTGFDLTLEKAIELHAAGGFDAAIQIYQSLRKDRPHDARLLYELAKSSLAARDLEGCIEFARNSAARESAYQADAFGVLARCENEDGAIAQSFTTYATALALHPENASLHFEYGRALQETGDFAAADMQFALALKGATEQPSLLLAYGNMLAASSEAGALLMNLRYIMAAPQSPLAVGAAEQILALVHKPSPSVAPESFDAALTAARLAVGTTEEEAGSDADQLSRFLQRFILNVVNAADPAMTGTVLWSGAVEPILAMAEHDVLDTYLYFVAALARTQGSPEWLGAHRQKFERLVEYLARVDTAS